MKIRSVLTVGAVAATTVGVLAGPASAAPTSPAQTCSTGSLHGQPLVSSVPFEGYFYRMGGCASTVAHGGLADGGVNISALTTQAGYVQTCQAIKAAPPEFGGWQGLATEATELAHMFGDDRTFTIRTMNDCVTALRYVHALPLPPSPEG